MAIQQTCPGCRTIYQLQDGLRGQNVRCKRCQRTFLVGPNALASNDEVLAAEPVEEVDDLNQALQPTPRRIAPANAGSSRTTAAVAVPGVLKRQPADAIAIQSSASSTAAILWILGGVAATLLLLCIPASVGLVVYALTPGAPVVATSSPPPVVPPPTPFPGVMQPRPGFAPPAPMPPPVFVPPPPPGPGKPTQPIAITLSNGTAMRGRGSRMNFSIDYQFTQGQMTPADRYFLVIKANGVPKYTSPVPSFRLSEKEGKLAAIQPSAMGDPGPFEVHLEVERFGAFGIREPVSNATPITVN